MILSVMFLFNNTQVVKRIQFFNVVGMYVYTFT